MLNIDLNIIEAVMNMLSGQNDDLAKTLFKINTKFEGIQGISSRDIVKIKEKYENAKDSQKNLTEALNAIIGYLGKVKMNYEKATDTVR